MSKGGISAADWYERRRLAVLDSHMRYVEVGVGDPIVLLHGNPTSSYLWRNVIPHLDGRRPLPGARPHRHGRSGKAPGGQYRFVDHARYLDAWFEATRPASRHARDARLGLGAGLSLGASPSRPREGARLHGGDRAAGDVGRVAGGGPQDLSGACARPPARRWCWPRTSSSSASCRPACCAGSPPRRWTDYREPFREPGEARRPTLTWPREIPVDGEPADVTALVDAYAKWLSPEPLPKLFINGNPGSILSGAPARVLPRVAEPAGGHRPRQPLPAGGLAGRDRPGHRPVPAPALIPRPPAPRVHQPGPRGDPCSSDIVCATDFSDTAEAAWAGRVRPRRRCTGPS